MTIYSGFLQCYVGKNSDLKFLLCDIIALTIYGFFTVN